jgi:hypothetical protein
MRISLGVLSFRFVQPGIPGFTTMTRGEGAFRHFKTEFFRVHFTRLLRAELFLKREISREERQHS